MTRPSESRAQRILRAVRSIPEGYVRTYGELNRVGDHAGNSKDQFFIGRGAAE